MAGQARLQEKSPAVSRRTDIEDGQVAGSEGMIQKGLLALALLAMVAFLPRLISRLRQRPW